MAVSTTSSNAANLHLYYERKLLDTLEPRLVYFNLGKKQRLPKGLGTQVKWLRYARISGDTTALTEGVAPSEIAFTTSNVTADVEQFGQFTKVSDLLSDTAIDPVLRNLSERFGRAAAATVEDLIINEVEAEANVQRVNDRTTDDLIVPGDDMSHTELIKNMIRMKQDFIGPHESGNYVCVIHPASQNDLLSDTQTGSWLDINKFVQGAQAKLMNGEFGMLYGIRLLVSDRNTIKDADNMGGTSVKRNYLVGEEAYGVVELNGRSLEMIVKDHKSGGVANPLNQFATVGYKIHGYKTKYLDSGSKRVIAIRSSAALG